VVYITIPAISSCFSAFFSDNSEITQKFLFNAHEVYCNTRLRISDKTLYLCGLFALLYLLDLYTALPNNDVVKGFNLFFLKIILGLH